MNEAQTRQDLIDPKLRERDGIDTDAAAGLRLSSPSPKVRSLAVVSAVPPCRPITCLQYRNRNVGVIEAKKRDLPYTEGVAQAKDYAERMQVRFAYATNGLKIYRIDMKLGSGGGSGSLSNP